MIEQDRSHSLIVAATNHPSLPDTALLRRFDDVLHYDLPNQSQIMDLLYARLSGKTLASVNWGSLAKAAAGLSYAEVARAANEILKDALIRQCDHVGHSDIHVAHKERKSNADRLNHQTDS